MMQNLQVFYSMEYMIQKNQPHYTFSCHIIQWVNQDRSRDRLRDVGFAISKSFRNRKAPETSGGFSLSSTPSTSYGIYYNSRDHLF
jgi:hypothetical protein